MYLKREVLLIFAEIVKTNLYLNFLRHIAVITIINLEPTEQNFLSITLGRHFVSPKDIELVIYIYKYRNIKIYNELLFQNY